MRYHRVLRGLRRMCKDDFCADIQGIESWKLRVGNWELVQMAVGFRNWAWEKKE